MTLSKQEIQSRKVDLLDAGFSADFVQKNIVIYNSLFKRSVRETIIFLLERGFKNPVKLITSFPSILGYSLDNIDWRLRYFCKLLKFCSSQITAQDVMESNTILWSTKREKMQILVRIAYDLHCTAEKEVISALTCNLENFLLVYIFSEEKDFRTIRLHARKAKNKYGTVKERRGKIQEFSDKLPSKVYSLYCKGYIR